ncbi:MAG: riboflavin synthase [Mariprofundaceae bacterium]
MFTGIIQDVGKIISIKHEAEQSHFSFETKLNMSRIKLGDSIAVDGCCLTVTALPSPQHWSATLSLETLSLTHFSNACIGQEVNMEAALCVGDALGGHIVTGHIDGLSKLKSIHNIGEHRQYSFEVPLTLAPYIVKKGSVCINGVSLTVNSVDECCFTVNLIPHTLSHTNLSLLQSNTSANLETDMLGRYVERMMQFQNVSET